MKGKTSGGRFAAVNELVRSWFFTINAHETKGVPAVSADQIQGAFRDIDPDGDFVFQMERGKQGDTNAGYLHFQATLLLSRNKPRRRRDVIRVLKEHGISDAHAEKVRRLGAATRYCSKSDTRVAGPWWSSSDFEERSKASAKANGSGARGDRFLLAEAVDSGMTPEQIILDPKLKVFMTPSNHSFVETYWMTLQSQRWQTEERNLTVFYLWGPTGAGKTRYVHDHTAPGQLYAADLASRDPFGKYRFESSVLFDEFRDSCSLSYLLQLLDRYPVQLDRRYENAWAAWDTVFICSNWPPETLYRNASDSDRAALMRRITKTIHMKGDSHDLFTA